jgi:hypothetical protein
VLCVLSSLVAVPALLEDSPAAESESRLREVSVIEFPLLALADHLLCLGFSNMLHPTRGKGFLWVMSSYRVSPIKYNESYIATMPKLADRLRRSVLGSCSSGSPELENAPALPRALSSLAPALCGLSCSRSSPSSATSGRLGDLPNLGCPMGWRWGIDGSGGP